MKAIGTGLKNNKSERTLKTGCHLVEIAGMELAKRSDGEIMATKGGDVAVKTTFTNLLKTKQISMNIWYTESARWVRKGFYHAINIPVDQGDDLHINDFIGKQLYICVAEVLHTFNGVVENKVQEYIVSPKGFYADHDWKPQVKGDPERGQNPEGTLFRIYKEQTQHNPFQ